MNVKFSNFLPHCLLLSAVFVALVVPGAGCNQSVGTDKEIVVSIMPQKQLLDAIVGDKIKVHSLLNASGDPETYDPSMSHLINVEKSQAYFLMGHIGFEDAIAKRVKASRPDLITVDTSKGIAPIMHGHGEGEADPHTWSSTVNARIIAKNMLDAVVMLDSANREYYIDNYNHLVAHIDSVDAQLAKILSTMRGKSFVSMHPSFGYFARDFGLRQLSFGAEHKEQSVKEMSMRLDSIAASGATLLVLQPDQDQRRIESLTSRLGCETIVINPLDYDWDEQLLTLARALSSTSK